MGGGGGGGGREGREEGGREGVGRYRKEGGWKVERRDGNE